MQRNNIFHGQFWGKIFIIGKTRCEKTYLMQKPAVNNFFGDILKAEWVSSIEITPTREADIQSNFSCGVEFHYPQTLEHFDDLIEDSKLKSIDYANIKKRKWIWWRKKNQRLIVMHDISGLADRSNTFASFLTVTRKLCYHWACIFHIILLENEIWKKYRKQMFSIFFHLQDLYG